MGSNSLETFRLGERCNIKSSKRIFAREYVECGVPFWRSKDVIDKSLGVFQSFDLFITQERFEEISDKFGAPQQGDLLISSVGNRSGQPYIVQNEGAFYFKDGNILWASRFVNLDAEFLAYWFKSNKGQSALSSVMIGSAQKALTIDALRSLEVTLPVYDAQVEAVKTLKLLDHKITLNRQINRTLEQMAQALFKSWFVDFDPVVDNALDAGFFAEHRDLPEALLRRAEQRKIVRQRPDFTPLPAETRQLFPAAFEACEEPSLGLGGWVPQGWKLGHLSDIAGYGSKRVDVLNLTVDNYISTENMLPDRKGVQPASNLPTLNSVPAYTTRYVLVSNIRPYFKKIWLASGDGGYSNDVLGFESKNAGDEHFLFNLLYQDVFFDFMMATSKGSKMPRGDKKTILSWGLVIPPLLLRKLFSTNVSHFYESMTHRNNECNTLSQLRDTLLPKLIAGELRLNDNAPAVGTDNND